jgi:ABC-type branched-subunit amino acid transport system ATPase component/branched-subunit amino acid ABC-type transport system permease component
VSDLLPFIVAGLVTGSAYGLASVGLTLTYRASGIMNFGHGALAAVAAYAFYTLYHDQGWPWPLALVVSVVVLGVVLGFVLELIGRRMVNASPSLQIVGTVGIILLVQGSVSEWKGTAYTAFPAYLPDGRFRVLSTNVSYAQAITFSIGLVITGLLYAFLRSTRLGYAMRAVVDDADLVSLAGTNPSTIRRLSWMIGSSVACLVGVLLAPTLSLDSILLTMLVVQAFGAAALGWFSNIPMSYVGGLVVGLATSLATKFVIGHQALAGLPSTVPFLVLFLALTLLNKDKFAVARRPLPPQLARWTAPTRVRVAAGVAVLAVLVSVPAWAGYRLPVYLVALATVVLFMSLGLLAKTAGQISLCHLAFAAISATAFSHLTDNGVPWLPALLIAGLLAVPAGVIVAIPAVRVSGHYLALATLGFGLVVERLFYSKDFMFGANSRSLTMPRPDGLETDTRYFYVVLTVALVIGLVLIALLATRLGRLMRGLADAPGALTTLGVSTNVTIVSVFSVSAFLAGIFGALYGAAINSANGGSFMSFNSLILLVVLLIIPGSFPWNCLVAAIAQVVMPSYIGGTISTYQLTALFGLSAILNATFGVPVLPPTARRLLDRLGGRRPETASPLEVDTSTNGAVSPRRIDRSPARARPGLPGLEISRLSVRYGGVVAMHELDLSAPLGRITGLIGPNGAGKTTTFNACSGLVHADSGSVAFKGVDISSLSPAARARAGIGRTFQRFQLFESQSVFDNITMGCEAPMIGRRIVGQFVGRRGERAIATEAAQHAMELCGIASMRDRQVSTLSTGQRRLVELARCLAGPFDLLLLDEPSSGLDRVETEEFEQVLRSVVAERGVGVVLIEHDLSLVMSSCDYLYVVDFGRLIFEGDPREVLNSDIVRAAYLGSDEAGESLSALSL